MVGKVFKSERSQRSTATKTFFMTLEGDVWTLLSKIILWRLRRKCCPGSRDWRQWHIQYGQPRFKMSCLTTTIACRDRFGDPQNQPSVDHSIDNWFSEPQLKRQLTDPIESSLWSLLGSYGVYSENQKQFSLKVLRTLHLEIILQTEKSPSDLSFGHSIAIH